MNINQQVLLHLLSGELRLTGPDTVEVLAGHSVGRKSSDVFGKKLRVVCRGNDDSNGSLRTSHV